MEQREAGLELRLHGLGDDLVGEPLVARVLRDCHRPGEDFLLPGDRLPRVKLLARHLLDDVHLLREGLREARRDLRPAPVVPVQGCLPREAEHLRNVGFLWVDLAGHDCVLDLVRGGLRQALPEQPLQRGLVVRALFLLDPPRAHHRLHLFQGLGALHPLGELSPGGLHALLVGDQCRLQRARVATQRLCKLRRGVDPGRPRPRDTAGKRGLRRLCDVDGGPLNSLACSHCGLLLMRGCLSQQAPSRRSWGCP